MEQSQQTGQQQQFKRQVAHIMQINDILRSTYHQVEGWNPNYIELNGKKTSRVNIIGTIITEVMEQETEENKILSFDIDDGTGTINARMFTKPGRELSVSVGDIVLIISRIREFGGQKYLSLEHVTTLKNKDWIEFRKKELTYLAGASESEIPSSVDVSEKQTEPKPEETEEIEQTIGKQQILDFIEKHDQGDGVSVDSISKQLNITDIDSEILELLKQGDAFEIKPGYVKLL